MVSGGAKGREGCLCREADGDTHRLMEMPIVDAVRQYPAEYCRLRTRRARVTHFVEAKEKYVDAGILEKVGMVAHLVHVECRLYL